MNEKLNNTYLKKKKKKEKKKKKPKLKSCKCVCYKCPRRNYGANNYGANNGVISLSGVLFKDNACHFPSKWTVRVRPSCFVTESSRKEWRPHLQKKSIDKCKCLHPFVFKRHDVRIKYVKHMVN